MTKIYLYGIIALGAIIALGYFIHSQRELGGEAERLRQEKENAQFQVHVRKGTVDYNTCDRAGGLYDFVKGTCKLPLDGAGR